MFAQQQRGHHRGAGNDHRADGGVTIMKGSNTPAEGRVARVVKVRTVRNRLK